MLAAYNLAVVTITEGEAVPEATLEVEVAVGAEEDATYTWVPTHLNSGLHFQMKTSKGSGMAMQIPMHNSSNNSKVKVTITK